MARKETQASSSSSSAPHLFVYRSPSYPPPPPPTTASSSTQCTSTTAQNWLLSADPPPPPPKASLILVRPAFEAAAAEKATATLTPYSPTHNSTSVRKRGEEEDEHCRDWGCYAIQYTLVLHLSLSLSFFLSQTFLPPFSFSRPSVIQQAGTEGGTVHVQLRVILYHLHNIMY